MVTPIVPGATDGPAKINLSNGNLVLRVPLPSSGCWNLTPVPTYGTAHNQCHCLPPLSFRTGDFAKRAAQS